MLLFWPNFGAFNSFYMTSTKFLDYSELFPFFFFFNKLSYCYIIWKIIWRIEEKYEKYKYGDSNCYMTSTQHISFFSPPPPTLSLFPSFLLSFNDPLDHLTIFGHGVHVTNMLWDNCLCNINLSIYHFDGSCLLEKYLFLEYKETTWRLNNKPIGEPRCISPEF